MVSNFRLQQLAPSLSTYVVYVKFYFQKAAQYDEPPQKSYLKQKFLVALGPSPLQYGNNPRREKTQQGLMF